MHHEPCRHAPGFTLVEMMAVVVITAIIAGIAYPSYFALMSKARRSEGRAALLQAMQQQERQYTQANSYAEFSRTSPSGFKWYSGITPQQSAYELSATACADQTLATCVQIDARPATEAVSPAASDPACGMLSLDSNGVRSAAGDTATCWN